MLASPQQPSTSFMNATSPIGVGRQPKRPTARDGDKEQIWVPLLQSASKGKDLQEKQVIILGGTPTQQREFLEHLDPEELRSRMNDRRRGLNLKNIPISNKYALGYTFHDVLDADQEDTLARLNVYMLTNPSAAFAPLLKPLLTAKSVKDTLIVVLLDWSDPFKWARQLRQWVRLLRRVIVTLDDETKIALEECLNAWKDKRVGPDAIAANSEQTVAPLGPGEWEDGLGIPLAVVCVRAEEIERLEEDLGWEDHQFDFLQQWLRTVLLKHGASLIYVASFDGNGVRALIHSSLSISSLLKKDVIKHNVMDRDKILVPPNWDSVGKIRILREGFDPETIGGAWSIEIQDKPEEHPDFEPQRPAENDPQAILETSQNPSSAVSVLEATLTDLTKKPPISHTKPSTAQQTIKVTPLQEFLQSQTGVLEKLQDEDRQEKLKGGRAGYLDTASLTIDSKDGDSPTIRSGAVSPAKGVAPSRLTDNIGPYQINVNGIDFDAEEATRRLRERENERNAARSARDAGISAATPSRTKSTTGAETPGTDKEKPSNEALHGFFANLIKKGQGGASRGNVGSGAPSPRRESPAPERRREQSSQQ